jgi:hypothetical protein
MLLLIANLLTVAVVVTTTHCTWHWRHDYCDNYDP